MKSSEHRDEDVENRQRLLDALFRGAALAALCLLVFIAGSVTAIEAVYPGPQITRALQGGKALYDKLAKYDDVHKTNLWYDARRTARGVTANAGNKVQEGFTLYTTGSEAAAYLIDLDGTVVHQWRRPFSTIPEAHRIGPRRPAPDSHIFFRHAHAFPNGDLLAIYEAVGDTPFGYGVVKLDHNSNVIWSYGGRAHHQLDVAADGRIYVLTHEIVDEATPPYHHLARPRLEDFLVILSPDGKEMRKVRLLTALARSKYRRLPFAVTAGGLADPLHANAVKQIDEEDTANFVVGRAGHVLLSFRETGTLAVLDPHREEVVWAVRGPWFAQHDPDVLANGNLLLFDNQGAHDGPEGSSRVIEFDPLTMRIVWQYAGTARQPLMSEIRSDQQRLANGNTLITESDGGRLVEVTPQGEVVWEFVNPVRDAQGGKRIPIIAWAQRMDRSAVLALLPPEQRGDREPKLTEVVR